MEQVMPTTSETARELLDIWDRVSSQHVSLGSGCACGVGGVTLQLQDFEQDIADFLAAQAERAKRDDVSAWLREHAIDAGSGRWNVAVLLRALIGEEQMAAPPDIAGFLLERLGKTLRSFARLHG
jgi:hypothetical protein